MPYRNILEAVRTEVPVKRYDTPCIVNGNIPSWLEGALPLFGSEDGDLTYLNSSGRSILVEQGEEVYRIKGADPKGVITTRVSDSNKNVVADIRSSSQYTPDAERVEKELNSKTRSQVNPFDQKKPWNFFTRNGVINSQKAFAALGEAYSERGFKHPCEYAGEISYSTLTWRGKPLYSLLFLLPDSESDLRLQEYEVQIRRYLQGASVEELQEIKDGVLRLYDQLVRWHAFDSRILMDAGLVPTRPSYQGHNYVLGHVGDGEVGLCRVDHTSTEFSPDGEQVRKAAEKYLGFITNIPMNVVLAIEMAKEGIPYDERRFFGYFDVAFKYNESITVKEFPETLDVLKRIEESFQSELENPNPEPIDESLLVAVYDSATSIEISDEQRRYFSMISRGLVPTKLIR